MNHQQQTPRFYGDFRQVEREQQKNGDYRYVFDRAKSGYVPVLVQAKGG